MTILKLFLKLFLSLSEAVLETPFSQFKMSFEVQWDSSKCHLRCSGAGPKKFRCSFEVQLGVFPAALGVASRDWAIPN